MSNSFFGNNLSKLEKLKLKEFEKEKQAEEIEKENIWEWTELHGAYQDNEGNWIV